jgi:hypothetical protein
MYRSNYRFIYWITELVRSRNDCGILRPSALPLLKTEKFKPSRVVHWEITGLGSLQ